MPWKKGGKNFSVQLAFLSQNGYGNKGSEFSDNDKHANNHDIVKVFISFM